jgi:hypothetical protein
MFSWRGLLQQKYLVVFVAASYTVLPQKPPVSPEQFLLFFRIAENPAVAAEQFASVARLANPS